MENYKAFWRNREEKVNGLINVRTSLDKKLGINAKINNMESEL